MSGAAAPVDLPGLDELLRPMPIRGEALRFDLACYRSRATREMLQIRLRLTAQASGAGSALVAANVAGDGAAIDVDARALTAANTHVQSTLDAGPAGAVAQLRRLSASRASLDRLAGAFRARVAAGVPPERRTFVRYVLAEGTYQALGGLKFCLPESLATRLAAWMEDPALVDALLAPEGPGLWSTLTARELALAAARLGAPAGRYREALARHRHEVGYLGGEDVDFRAHESLEAIDARAAALAEPGPAAVAAQRRRLAQAAADDRARKARAREVFADRVAAAGATQGVATLVSHVLLARALTAHEDLNRRAKMRFLRDLRDLAGVAGLELERTGLEAFAAACPPRRGTSARPVVRSA